MDKSGAAGGGGGGGTEELSAGYERYVPANLRAPGPDLRGPPIPRRLGPGISVPNVGEVKPMEVGAKSDRLLVLSAGLCVSVAMCVHMCARMYMYIECIYMYIDVHTYVCMYVHAIWIFSKYENRYNKE